MPNKTDQESFSAFRGGSGCGGSSPHGRGGVGRRGGGSGCGRCGSRFANFQCQVCFKFVHTTSVCYYHYDQYYQPITTTIHRIVTILVILDLLMFGLIPITNLSVTILSPIIVLFTNTQPQSNSTNWILDSGASFYVTGESQNIQQLEPFEGPNQIFIGNGQGLQIHSLENWHSTMQLEYETLIKNHT